MQVDFHSPRLPYNRPDRLECFVPKHLNTTDTQTLCVDHHCFQFIPPATVAHQERGVYLCRRRALRFRYAAPSRFGSVAHSAIDSNCLALRIGRIPPIGYPLVPPAVHRAIPSARLSSSWVRSVAAAMGAVAAVGNWGHRACWGRCRGIADRASGLASSGSTRRAARADPIRSRGRGLRREGR